MEAIRAIVVRVESLVETSGIALVICEYGIAIELSIWSGGVFFVAQIVRSWYRRNCSCGKEWVKSDFKVFASEYKLKVFVQYFCECGKSIRTPLKICIYTKQIRTIRAI